MELNTIYNTDCLQGVEYLDDNSIDCVVTSPPYWKLRDYGIKNQLGQEQDATEYLAKLLQLFDALRPKLKDESTIFVNLGDTYNTGKSDWFNRKLQFGLDNKTLLLLPYRFAIAMCERGWICRNIINWRKINPLPQSAKDRFTVDFEPIFFFTKKTKGYFYKQQLEPYKTKPIIKRNACKLQKIGVIGKGERNWYKCGGKNIRTTWDFTNGDNGGGNHIAVYPKKLVARMLKAGCPTDGLVLDPFIGSGTTAIVARGLGMNYIGFELNPDYCELSKKRLADEAGLFG
ncbi:MAG: site-specific DNA-methyltransferase [Ignavibacteria bacterium]|jgi:site-specific DNA-methyltransferase (adenine-specific)|nr:site-specific DNA-methyltransferase [Ignavibacteria bacterium]